MRVKYLIGAAALAIGAVTSGCGPTLQPAGQTTGQTTKVVTSGACPRERALVRPALDRSRLRADVDGDGRPDRVAVAWDFAAAKPCRAFVAVRVRGGATYSTHLFPQAAPIKGLRPEVVGLPRLGSGRRAVVVVDTKAAVDSLLAQMFTLADGRLRAVNVPGFEDQTFIVEGAGVVYPYGAACTADGRMVISNASQTKDGKRYKVTRRTYDVRGRLVRFVDPVVKHASVPVNLLVTRFPEFAAPHWAACGGTVRPHAPSA